VTGADCALTAAKVAKMTTNKIKNLFIFGVSLFFEAVVFVVPLSLFFPNPNSPFALSRDNFQ